MKTTIIIKKIEESGKMKLNANPNEFVNDSFKRQLAKTKPIELLTSEKEEVKRLFRKNIFIISKLENPSAINKATSLFESRKLIQVIIEIKIIELKIEIREKTNKKINI